MTVEDDGVGLVNKSVDVSSSTNTGPRLNRLPIPLAPNEIFFSFARRSKNGTGIGLANLRARL